MSVNASYEKPVKMKKGHWYWPKDTWYWDVIILILGTLYWICIIGWGVEMIQPDTNFYDGVDVTW